MYKLLKFGAALAIIGVIAAVAGLLLSAGNSENFFEEQDYVMVSESIDVGSLTHIILDMENRRIVVGESSTGKIEIVYYESEKDPIDSTVEGTDLSLVNDPVWYWGFMWWMNWTHWFSGDKTTVTVNIPAGTAWDLDLESENGNIEVAELDFIDALLASTTNGEIVLGDLAVTQGINASTTNGGIHLDTLTSTSLRLTTTNGRVILSDVSTGPITVVNTNGDINFSNVTADSIDATNTNGRYDFTDVSTTGEIDISTTNGAIDLVRITAQDVDCRSTNGDIDVTLYGVYEDYFCNFQTETGSVRVDGESEGEGEHHGTKIPRIVLRTVNGSIELDFLD